jgi:hypothetical protein
VGRRNVDAVLDVMTAGRGVYARRQAALTAERLWNRDVVHRGWIWDWLWLQADRYALFQINLLSSYGQFLLAPDPGTTHEPRIRMVAGMSLPGDRREIVRVMAALANGARDEDLRAGAQRVLSTSGEPHILAGLEDTFVQAVRVEFWIDTTDWDAVRLLEEEALRPLWWIDSEQSPLLTAVLANPHLPRSVVCRGRPVPELALLAALRGRFDLVAHADTRDTAGLLLTTARRHGDDGRRALDGVLRFVGPGPIRERACQLAMAEVKEALNAVRTAGVLPADADVQPLFLFMTRQWDRLDALDPDWVRLRRYADALAPDDPERDRLRAVASENGRRRPCKATRRPRSSGGGGPAMGSSSGYRPGGSSTSGTGGYASGGISVHGA